MKCPKCQTEVSPDDKFCRECAYDLRKAADLPPKDFREPHSYTPKHLTDRILTNRSSIEGERKLVTVLFADVANYTALAEKLDPERVHQIMDGCFKVLMDEIHRYEGTINQFTGDGVMALFGAPLAHEDHAQRACLAALGIQEALRKYGKDLESRQGVDFKMRVGLNSGPVVVGAIGDDLRMDYTAIGDTTNLAFRIQSLAEPGNILVSPGTYRMVRDSFELAPQGKVAVKGREEPIEAFKLKQKREFHRPRLGYERQIYSEMVGRDNELAQLELQVMKAVTGEGSIVNIIGEAGIGKSRLVAELRNREVIKRVTLLEGRAISMGRNLSFHPIIDLLKNWARIKEDDTETAAFEKLKSAIRNVHPKELDEILPFVATLMGMKLSGRYAERVKGIEGEALEKLILKNVRDLLIRVSEVTPIGIVMEDLHWADTSSIELLESLLRLVETQKIVFVNIFRPGHKETGDRIVKTIKERYLAHSVELSLQALDERTSQTLINNMLNITGLRHGVQKQIIERSGGNPYFIEEVVRSFIDEGAVVMKDGAFEVTEKINTMVIPQTISDVLMARIDRLEEETRNLIKVASVIGRNFFHRILAEVAKATADMEQRLSYLKDIQIIRERKRMEELEYLFKHALAQEAAYESILLKRRKELHLKVADSIERVFTERLHEFYGMLAFHYSRGEDEDKAEEYLIKAGEEALKSSASSEALYYYQEALTLYLKKYGEAADLEKVATIEKNIAIALYNKGHLVKAVECFDKALAYYGVKTPRHFVSVIWKILVRFVHVLISVYLPSLRGKKIPTQADNKIVDLLFKRSQALSMTDHRRFLVESLHLLKRVADFDLTKIENGVEIVAASSLVFSWPGISFRLSRRMLDFARDKLDDQDLVSLIYYGHSELMHHVCVGGWDMISEYDDDLVDRTLGLGEIFVPSCYVIWHAIKDVFCGCFLEARRKGEKADEIADIYENQQTTGMSYVMKVLLLTEQRKLHIALDVLERGISFATKTDQRLAFTHLHSFKARVQIMAGDISGAEKSLSCVKENLSEIKAIPYPLASFLNVQFILDIHTLEESTRTGKKTLSAENRRKVLKTGRKSLNTSSKFVGNRTEALRLMGKYYWLIGKQRRAIKWWNKSIQEGERLGARPELSRTYMEVGKRLLEPHSKYKELNGLGAEEYLNKARTMFEEMDLQWDLEELERIAVTN